MVQHSGNGHDLVLEHNIVELNKISRDQNDFTKLLHSARPTPIPLFKLRALLVKINLCKICISETHIT